MTDREKVERARRRFAVYDPDPGIEDFLRRFRGQCEIIDMTPQQRDEICNDVVLIVRDGLNVRRFFRPYTADDPRIAISPLPLRRGEYGEVAYLYPRWDGISIQVEGNNFNYGDPYEFLRSARIADAPSSKWPVGVFGVTLFFEGDRVRIDDRFEFDRATVLAFLEQELPKIGGLQVIPEEYGDVIHFAIDYHDVPKRQSLRDARRRYDSQSPRERVAELFGEKIAAAALYLEAS